MRARILTREINRVSGTWMDKPSVLSGTNSDVFGYLARQMARRLGTFYHRVTFQVYKDGKWHNVDQYYWSKKRRAALQHLSGGKQLKPPKRARL